MMDFALSNVRLTASGVEISGLAAPFCTAIARRSLAMTVALPGTMLPVLSASGKGAKRSDTSKACPLATVFRVLTPVPYVILTWIPDFASKSPTNFSIVALMGSGDKRVIALWAFRFDEKASANEAATRNEIEDFNFRSFRAKTTVGDRAHRSSKPRQGAVDALDEDGAAALLHVLTNPVINEL